MEPGLLHRIQPHPALAGEMSASMRTSAAHRGWTVELGYLLQLGEMRAWPRRVVVIKAKAAMTAKPEAGIKVKAKAVMMVKPKACIVT
jgi:hypothetical protein